MLKIGSKLNIYDNSGAIKVSILKVFNKRNCLSYNIKLNDLIYGVVKEIEPFKKKKKLRRRRKVDVLVVTTVKKYNRGCGIYINFDENRGIPLKISRFTKPLATKVYTAITKELSKLKKYKIVVKLAGYPY